MDKRTSIGYQSVRLEDHIVTIYDNEWYGQVSLALKTLEEADQCYKDTVAILVEAHDKLAKAGWAQARDWELLKPNEVVY